MTDRHPVRRHVRRGAAPSRPEGTEEGGPISQSEVCRRFGFHRPAAEALLATSLEHPFGNDSFPFWGNSRFAHHRTAWLLALRPVSRSLLRSGRRLSAA